MRRFVWLLTGCLLLTFFCLETSYAQKRGSRLSYSGSSLYKSYTPKSGSYFGNQSRLSTPKSYSSKGHLNSTRLSSSHYTPSYSNRKAIGVERDGKGRIKRSESEKSKFLRQEGYKKVPEGYEVDHIVPLYKGGADEVSNMQLIPKSQHKAKHAKR